LNTTLPPALADSSAELRARNQCAWGHRPPDVVLTGGRVLVASGELLQLDVAILGRRIVAVAPSLASAGVRTVDVGGRYLVPGYVEPHGHAFAPLSPSQYLGRVLETGTTCTTTDDYHLNQFLPAGSYGRLLDHTSALPLVVRWSLRVEPQATRTLDFAGLQALLARPEIVQLGELPARPDLEHLDEPLAQLLAQARAAGRRIDGHNPGATQRTLTAAGASGVTADHEALSADDVMARLRTGLWAFLRHSSLRPDIPQLVPALVDSALSLERVALTVDGSTPAWMARHGFVNAAIGAAIEAGMAPFEAYASATWRPAAYMRIDEHLGAIAPGRLANINVLGALEDPMPESVISMGREVAREGRLTVSLPAVPWDALGARPWSQRAAGPALGTFRPEPEDPAVRLVSTVILREGAGDGPGLSCVALDPLSGRGTRARLHGLAPRVRAVASTMTFNRLLVVIGSDPQAMKRTADAVFAAGGGIAYDDGERVDLLELPIGGVISEAPFGHVAGFCERLERHLAELGHPFADPLYTLHFLTTDSLPAVRFTREGLLRVKTGEIISPAVELDWDGGHG
jgi:adenine deaminase